MRREYESPRMVVEEFEANEYIAACGDENRVYKFECTSDSGYIHYYPNSDGNIDGVYNGNGDPNKISSPFSPCNKKHESPVNSAYYDGFVDRNNNSRCDEGEAAIIWLEWEKSIFGTYLKDGHATSNLNMNSWVTAKS